MAKYWLLSIPCGNIEITISSKLIGGKSSNVYERFFKENLPSEMK
jgi:hypothetical protein